MEEGWAGDGVWEEADADAAEPGPAPPESRPEEPGERAEEAEALEEAGGAGEDEESGGWDGTLGEAGEDGAPGETPETPPLPPNQQSSSDRLLRSTTRQLFPEQGPLLKMGPTALRQRERLVRELIGAGLEVPDLPSHWTRQREGRDVCLYIHVNGFGTLKSRKSLAAYTSSLSSMTDTEREIVEEALWMTLWNEVRMRLGRGRRKRKRTQPTDEPSTSGFSQPIASHASSSASSARDPIGIAGFSATTVRGRTLDTQRYLKNCAQRKQEELETRLGVGDASQELAEKTEKALEALAKLDARSSSVLLPLKRRKAFLSSSTHGDVIERVSELLQAVFEELSQVLAGRTPAGPASDECASFRQSWAELTDLWRRLEKAPVLQIEDLPPPASESSHSHSTTSAPPPPPLLNSSPPRASGSPEIKQEMDLQAVPSEDPPRSEPSPSPTKSQAVAQAPAEPRAVGEDLGRPVLFEEPSRPSPAHPTPTQPPKQDFCVFCAQPRQDHHTLTHCKAQCVTDLKTSVFGITDPWSRDNYERRCDFFAALVAIPRAK